MSRHPITQKPMTENFLCQQNTWFLLSYLTFNRAKEFEVNTQMESFVIVECAAFSKRGRTTVVTVGS
jgi:hypothetical protein